MAYAAQDALLLVDPLVPDDLWEPLDEVRRRHGKPVAVCTTIRFHQRSLEEVVRRFEAKGVRGAADLPSRVETIRIPRAGETMVWLPEHAALVPGDRLLGDDEGGLRLCPPGWLRYLKPGLTHDELRAALRRLLEFPVELVLVSHGQPVLEKGRAAIERALT